MSSVIFASVYSYDAWWRTIESLESFCLFKVIWWRHQMKTFSALLAICAGNSPVPGEFPAQSDAELWCFLRSALNQRLSKQSWGWRFETPSRPLWRHCNVVVSWVVGCLYTSHVGCRFTPPPPPPPQLPSNLPAKKDQYYIRICEWQHLLLFVQHYRKSFKRIH